MFRKSVIVLTYHRHKLSDLTSCPLTVTELTNKECAWNLERLWKQGLTFVFSFFLSFFLFGSTALWTLAALSVS
jgi:hypothetical protein